MDISQLVSRKERIKLLEHILYHPSEEIIPNRLAKKVGVSRSQAHKYVGILRREKLVKGKRLEQTPFVQAIRALLNIIRIEEAGVGGILRKHFPGMKGWGIFGSFAAGSNTEGSDLDIWIKLDREPEDLAKARARNEASQKLGTALDLIAATPQRLKSLREKSDSFYFSLYNGKIMWGEGL